MSRLPVEQERLAILRKCLGDSLERTLSERLDLLRKLKPIYPHSITQLLVEKHRRERMREYRCFAFALELDNWDGFFALTSRRLIISAALDIPFVELMLTKVAERPAGDVRDDDLVVYYSDDEIRHAGVVCGSLVRSKWGDTEFWHHATFEVPAEYGSTVRYFQRPFPVLRGTAN
jgi:hypothetical protein